MADPNLSSFIWSVADLLRGDFKQSEYGKVILPFTVLRRLDCVLDPTKPAVLAELAKRTQAKINPEPFLLRKSGQFFYNTSPLDLKKLMGDQDHIGENLRAYMNAFSPAVRDIFESFDFHTQIDRLSPGNGPIASFDSGHGVHADRQRQYHAQDPPHFAIPAKCGSNCTLGLLLVSDLSRQIGGELVIGPCPGSHCQLTMEGVMNSNDDTNLHVN